jgi:hypothetical protein
MPSDRPQTHPINLLIGRGMLKKLGTDTVRLTDAGRNALAKIKEAAQ